MDLETRQRYLKRFAMLESERSSWIAHWRDLSDYVLPRRGRYFETDVNKGDKRNQFIINGRATKALRVLSSGMMAGITSPARKWFRLGTPDPDLSEYGPVRQWLHVVEERINSAFHKSNFYTALPILYGNLALFGTSAAIIDEDHKDILRMYVLPTGQYSLANNDRQDVDTLYRKLSMTVGQSVQKFGLENCSPYIQQQFKQGNYDTWVQVAHLIEPNLNQDTGRLDARGMAWKSCWFEFGTGNQYKDITSVLREGGYQEKPFVAPRWEVTGEDVYGSSPAMDVLGDIKALQKMENRKLRLVDKLSDPPMKGPTSMRFGGSVPNITPGGVTYVDQSSGGTAFEPAMLVNPAAIAAVGEEIRRAEQHIDQHFMADLWLMLANSDSPAMTAREVAERHEEKMLQLGPVLENLHGELLFPAIDRAFAILHRWGMLPPPPEELQGSDLRIEPISILAQAQKLLEVGPMDRLVGVVGGMAQANPEILDKLNGDKIVDEYGRLLGVKPDLIRTEDEVTQIRQARAQQQQQAQAAAQGQAMADGAKTLSETDTTSDNALTRLMNNLGGVAAASGGGVH